MSINRQVHLESALDLIHSIHETLEEADQLDLIPAVSEVIEAWADHKTCNTAETYVALEKAKKNLKQSEKDHYFSGAANQLYFTYSADLQELLKR